MNEQKRGGIAAFAINNAHVTIVLFLAATLLGGLSLVMLPKDLLPPANLPAIQILSFYGGMPVDHVEQDLTYMFERYTGQAVGVRRQESRSLVGVSIVRNFFNPSVDLSNAIAQTSSLVMSVLRKLPPGTQPPLILPFDPMASVPLAMVAIGGEGKTEAALQVLGRYSVTNGIQSVSGAMAPAVMGGQTRQINVVLDGKKLSAYNLSLVRVMDVMNRMNTFIPAGDVKVGNFDYQILTNGLVENVADMNHFLLRAENGVPVSLSDVGRVEDAHAIQTNVVRIDSKPQVYVPVYRQPGANSLAVVDGVREAMQKLEATLSGFSLKVVADQSVFIRKAIESISHEALIGGGLAALMVLVFLGSWRATIAVLLSLPISLVAAFACLKVMGQSLNVMTLGGLALSVGVLVDNAIVVIEVIMHKQRLGQSAKNASLNGANEVAMPVLASTVSTLVVFIPVIFLDGVVKILFSALALAVISSMAASYFAAMMVIPLFTTHFLKAGPTTAKGVLGFCQRIVDAMTVAYGKSLGWVVRWRAVVLPVAITALVALGVVSYPRIGAELFPRADAGSMRIDLRGPTGTRVEETTALAAKIEAKLREWIPAEDLEMIITNAGVYYGYPAAFTPNSGPQDVFFNVELTENRRETSQYYAKIIRERLPKAFPQVEFGIELGGLLTSALNGGLMSPIDVQVIGPHYEQAKALADQLAAASKDIAGAVDVRVQQRFDAPQVKLTIDRARAKDLGLEPDLIIKNVDSAVSNSVSFSPSIWIDPKTGIDFPFGAQFAEGRITKLDELLDIPLMSTTQKRAVPLGRVAKISMSKGPTELNHVNLQPVIDLYMDAQGRDIAGVAADVQKKIDAMVLPKGYEIKIRGEVAEMQHAVGTMGGGFVLAAIMVYLILVMQFRSFVLPAIIMTTVPMGMVGVLAILAFWPTYFSIQAAIGCIFVIGVAVSHGVLLVEYILECTHDEPDIDKAIIKGGMARWRPITMTSLASILGLLPMAFGMGQGAEANIPLGRAVIGGQILSTLLNFYLVPCLFRMIYGRRTKATPDAPSSATIDEGLAMSEIAGT